MLWIALHLPDLPLQVFTRGLAEAGALAVVEHRPRQQVLAASPAARACGVEPGMRVVGALAVVPGLVLRDRDVAAERALLAALANCAGCFSPALSLDPPDCVMLEVGTCLRLFGGLAGLIERLADALAAQGLDVRLAAAPTPLAASWLALARPGRRIEAEPGWAEVLNDLPIELIARGGQVSEDNLALLRGIGADRVGAIARLPRDALARREAVAVSAVLARARGEIPDPRPWYQAPPTHASRLLLPAPVDATEPLLFACRRLFAGLTAWLTVRLAAIDRCQVFLEHADRPDTLIEIVTGEPGRCEARLGMLLREHLNRLELPAPVEALKLHADCPVFQPARSQDLFGDPHAARDGALRLVDRLCARLGSDAVFSLRLQDGHRPETAWSAMRPGHRPASGVQAAPGQRPLWLLDEPRPLAAIDELRLLSGPERIESGWWDGHDIQRDYFVARSPDDALWWIFRALDEPGGWYVHGYFG